MKCTRSSARLRIAFSLIALGFVSRASAATLPEGFREVLVASGLAAPTAMQFAPDGRLFVCEQAGRLRVVKNGTLLTTPFVSLPVDSSGERGLLGIAFDPGFATNHFLYVYYTAMTPSVHNRISRFTANGDVAVPGSEIAIFDLDNLSSATNHNGGALAFGADGKLYAAVGENANGANAQSLGNVLGKMLRINPNGTIPGDNPFLSSTTGKNQAIWALGLRNPFTFAFNPAGAEMYINDVGQSTWEEINEGTVGANYGWPATEGATNDPRFKTPLYSYDHSGGTCAITGGAFYAPLTAQFPAEYSRDYFFADFCGGWIRKLDFDAGHAVVPFASGIASPVDLKVSADGALYYLARGSGSAPAVVVRIEYVPGPPTITTHPTSQAIPAGSAVTFSVRASGTPPLQYQWRRNNVDIPGATLQDYTIGAVAVSDNTARFRAIVTNSAGNALSDEAVLTVTGGPPTTAAFLGSDTTTQGTWRGTYGAEGYQIVNDGANYPSYATVTTTGAEAHTWALSTSDGRGLQKAVGTDRIAATWYSGAAFALDVNLTDGLAHQVAIYVVDWDNRGRSETVEIRDAVSGALLDSRALSAFTSGQYWRWTLRGHLTVRVTNTGTPNAVLSGIFFDASSSNPAPAVALTSPAEGATYTAPASLTVTATATDANGIDRVEFYQTLSQGQPTLIGPAVTSPPYSIGWSNVTAGSYTLTAKAYDTLGQAATSVPVHITVNGAGGGGTSATFVGSDTTTRGTWRGTYGADGYHIVNDSVSYPSYAAVTMSGADAHTWALSTTDVRGLQKAVGTDRIAATWYSASAFALDLNLTDGLAHQVAIYVVDWDNRGRSETVEIRDAVSGALLDSRAVSAFTSGQYWRWTLRGHVIVRVLNTGTPNAVVSGIFFDQ
jgi:glucose/arabinose dehydrogenase